MTKIITLKIDNAPNIQFKGALIGSAQSSDDRALRSWFADYGSLDRAAALPHRFWKGDLSQGIPHNVGKRE